MKKVQFPLITILLLSSFTSKIDGEILYTNNVVTEEIQQFTNYFMTYKDESKKILYVTFPEGTKCNDCFELIKKGFKEYLIAHEKVGGVTTVDFWDDKEVNKTFKLRTDTIREYDNAGYKIKFSLYKFTKSA